MTERPDGAADEPLDDEPGAEPDAELEDGTIEGPADGDADEANELGGADEDEGADLVEEEVPAAGAGAAGDIRRRRGTEAPAGRRLGRALGRSTPARPATPSEAAVRVDDRVSAVFVVVTLAVFALILLNGIFLGRGGVFTPIPTPSPVPSASPSGSAGASPSASIAPSVSVAPSPSAGASPSSSPAASPSPS